MGLPGFDVIHGPVPHEIAPPVDALNQVDGPCAKKNPCSSSSFGLHDRESRSDRNKSVIDIEFDYVVPVLQIHDDTPFG